jgi:hypothetical protein
MTAAAALVDFAQGMGVVTWHNQVTDMTIVCCSAFAMMSCF